MTVDQFRNPVFVALDTPDLGQALAVARNVGPFVGGLKIGLEFITANGPDGVRKIVQTGVPVFADVKFHDIPNTVAGASREIARLGAKIFNVHTSGGKDMMSRAADAARSIDPQTMIVGVTLLTSLDDADLDSIGQRGPASDQVVRLASLAKASGLDGIVCSAHEVTKLRKALGPNFLLIVPGLRPAGVNLQDQRRVMSPSQALQLGADILVIGRPITAAPDPTAAARAIAAELENTMA